MMIARFDGRVRQRSPRLQRRQNQLSTRSRKVVGWLTAVFLLWISYRAIFTPGPTLVLVGELDEPFLAASRRLAETIPAAELVVLPGGGHSPQFEATHEWRGAVDEFLGANRAVAPGAS